MNNKKLIFIDKVVGLILLPLSLIFRLIGIVRRRYREPASEKILVIKFLGAGNLISIDSVLANLDVDLITAHSNRNTVITFLPKAQAFFLNDANIFSLTVDVLRVFYSLMFKNYACVVNLETESYFAKFLTAVSNSKKYCGISNTHKGLFDNWLYDFYLVNPILLSKAQVLSLLLDYRELTNDNMAAVIQLHQMQFKQNQNIRAQELSTVVIAPTCSSTDVLRRVSIANWSQLIAKLPTTVQITAIFPNQHDPQYLAFKKLEVEFANLKVQFTNFVQFVERIQTSDLVICIDSQALHVAQEAGKKTIALYGPTSPFGVNLSQSTYPITKSLACSPCTHKYFKLPCNNKASCMQFSATELNLPLI